MPELTNRTAVGLILNAYDEILLQKKDGGYIWHPRMWGFFGGQLKGEETPLEALHREVEREELGITLADIVFFKEHPYSDTAVNGKRRGGILYAFGARFTAQIKDIRLGEGAGFAFFGREEVPYVPLVSHNKDLVMDYYRHLDQIRTR